MFSLCIYIMLPAQKQRKRSAKSRECGISEYVIRNYNDGAKCGGVKYFIGFVMYVTVCTVHLIFEKEPFNTNKTLA